MNFKKIGTKMLVMILPILVLAQIVLTIISATSSESLVDRKTQESMQAELRANSSEVTGYLQDVETLANSIAISVASSYTYTEWAAYEKMLQDMIATNDIVLGSGLWFEPYAYDPEQQYYGPYVYKDVPVIFLTGIADKEHVDAVLDLKPAGYFVKPPMQTKIINAIENIFLKQAEQ